MVVNAFLLISCESLVSLSTLLHPFFLEASCQLYRRTVNRHFDCDLMGKLWNVMSLLVQSLNVKLLSVLAVLAEKHPRESVKDSGLSASVATVD